MSNEAGAADGSRVVYRSRISVEPRPGKLKLVTLPLEPEPVRMGFHDELATHAGLADGAYPPTASTLDYLVEAAGDVEDEAGILVLRRIHLVAHLVADESRREAAERAAATFHGQCPLYRSIGSAVAITSELDFRPLAAP